MKISNKKKLIIDKIKYKIKFFIQENGQKKELLKNLTIESFIDCLQSNKIIFNEAREKLFDICSREQWATNPIKSELINSEIKNLIKLKEFDNNKIQNLLNHNSNYDLNKICHYDKILENDIIIELGDDYYYYDNYKIFFEVFRVKKIKKG